MSTLPTTDPIHRGLSEGQLLGYIADYLQTVAASPGIAGSTGGNGSADSGKAALFDIAGALRAMSMSLATGPLNIGTGTAGWLSGGPAFTSTRTITSGAAHTFSAEDLFYSSLQGYCPFDALTRAGWGCGVTGDATTNILTALSSVPLVEGQAVRFGWLVGGAGLSQGVRYYVRDVSELSFRVSATLGGAAVDFSSNITSTTGNPSWMGLELDHCAGGQARMRADGYIPKFYGWNAQPEAGPYGVIGEAINFYATDVVRNSISVGGVTYTGKVETQYGILLGALTVATYNIAFASTSPARSYHNGPWTFGTNSYPALDCAMVRINSTTAGGDGLHRGLLLPRVTTAQKSGIASPLAGLVVYDTSLNKLCVYNGSVWETVTSV